MDRLDQKLVTIFGGSGFVGTQIVQELARRGHRIRVAVRRPDLAGHVRPLGNVGQVMPVQANIRNRESVEHAVAGADIVINLVGIGFESAKQTFRAVHVDGAKNIAEAASAAGVQQLVHMSILGAGTAKTSATAESRLGGETAIFDAFPNVIVLRPSLIFGYGDGFFNLMGSLARLFPAMPLIGGKTRFQPVYVGDVAEAFVLAAEGKVEGGKIYELGGPEVLTHRELLKLILSQTGRNRPLIPLSDGMAKLMAAPFSILPFPPLLTSDQVELLGTDNIVSEEAMREGRTFEAFGITPTAMEAILPTYMWRFRKHGQFDRHVSSGTNA
ncbi:3-beta-hydroxy-Delta(5)-steroid dehydrogenase [Devosia pacifica]|uniref:3-beta-hydroxy-Delta(5)-steroid dehydrogenase n=1 Tax=Devosia pacifica TaxID=1335967 RepID=A0A918S3Z4_9HYPH|nr:complex I NDUFA9 subunit family protein [Devosia pacifica]GHA22940.1 3-beta-hydroxy-Delta(5)-steroid dehydrogenase [Devosia pacifica]